MARSTAGRRRATAAQRKTLLEDYHRSGLSQRAYARQAGIGLSTLQLWLRRRRAGGDDKPVFVEVPTPVLPAMARTTAAYRLRGGGRWVLEIAAGIEIQDLAALLRHLEVG